MENVMTDNQTRNQPSQNRDSQPNKQGQRSDQNKKSSQQPSE